MRFSRPTALRGAALVAGLALVATGCGSDDSGKDKDSGADAKSDAPTSCEEVESGEASDAVEVTGEFGKEHKASFKTPLEADGLQRTVATEGDGADVKANDQIDILLTVFSGKDGKSFGTSPAPVKAGDAQIPDAFRATFDCMKIGTRSVVTVPAKDVYGEEGNPQAGIGADDTLVIVTDVLGEKKQLKPAAWTQNKATVDFAADGKPTLELPAGKPEPELRLEVLKPGTGPEVGAGDTVKLDYQGTSWNTKKIFDQSYGGEPASFATDQVVPGFGAALVGQKVGSRVVVTIPPEHAYGDKGAHELGGQTLVFVIEILDVTPAG